MCTPSLSEVKPEPVTDSKITPTGNEPLLIGQTKPAAPHGYVARFVEGQWRIVPDPAVYGGGVSGGGNPGQQYPGLSSGTSFGGSGGNSMRNTGPSMGGG